VVKYYNSVDSLNTPLVRFFAISLAIHCLFLLMWAKPSHRFVPQESIPVSLLPPPPPPTENSRDRPSPPSRETPRRPSKTPAQIAKKNSPPARREKTVIAREVPAEREPKQEEARPPSREQIPDKAIIAERPLPTLKELLPPVGWSAAQGTDEPIRLDTKNPQYVTYFTSIKRAIEVVWQYPELALRYGLQGRLLLEFSILGNGDLESAKIVRSSGSNVLDDEALRAVKAAAPFGPIPSWVGKNRIDIIASFEYLDNRLNYRVVP
jgi:periplasmic protein TonB